MTSLLLPLLACSDDAPAPSDPPGTVVLHRLNRAEYDNTVRDLFGTALRPAEAFPADDFAVGFDNIAMALSMSALHVERYDAAADDLLDELFAFGNLPSTTTLVEAEDVSVRHDAGGLWQSVAWALFDEGDLATTIWVDTAADHVLGVDAYAVQAGDEPVRIALRVDGADVATFDVTTELEPARFEIRVPLTAGSHTLAAAFLNDFQSPPDLDRTLVVDRFVITGPLDVPRPPAPNRALVLTCDPAVTGDGPCAEEIVRGFGRRAFRRPLGESEVANALSFYSMTRGLDQTWDEGMRAALKSLLLSPWFVYRVEPDPIDGPRPLNGFELASRLSYFVWSSTPDDRLLDLAEAGELTDPEVLVQEARRLLADPRSEALVDNLGGQWLGIRKIDEATPNREAFPAWDEGLRASMKDEMTRFVSSILREDRSAIDLFTADTTFVDARLAEHYGVADFTGEGLVEVTIPERKGLLTKGAILTSLAYPTRTSPVLRGKWVLENLLCTPPPPPPDDVPPFDSVLDEGEVISIRTQLERHVADPACQGCHLAMDPIGFGLEHYSGIGSYRTIDELGFEVDASGELITGEAFVGVDELQAILATDPRVPSCMVNKTFTYALGRAIDINADAPFLEELGTTFADSGYRFDDLVAAIVVSRPFRWKEGQAP